MTPELSAIADRFIYEQATLKHILVVLPPDTLDRKLDGRGQTVRQLLIHLARSLDGYAKAIDSWLRAEQPLTAWDPHATLETVRGESAPTSPSEIGARLGSGLNALISCLKSIPDERLEAPPDSGDPIGALKLLGNHCLAHAPELVDALPEIRYDPLVLNWLLSATFQSEKDNAWQTRLHDDAREYIAAHIHEEEEEEGDE
jgi:hypothetical protein